jgi:hypothetical protein
MATALANLLNNSVSGPSYFLQAQATAMGDGTQAISLFYPGSGSNGWALQVATSTNTGATEVMTVVAGSHPQQTVVIGQNAVVGPALGSISGVTAVGYSAGNELTTGSYNSLFGNNSGVDITSGVNNSFFGSGTGSLCLTCNSNVAVGYNALGVDTTGSNNVAIGQTSLNANTTGGGNTAVGLNALLSNSTGSANSGYGQNALLHSTGGNNTAIGLDALEANTSGSNNVGIGYLVGSATLSTGSNNILIGTGEATVDTPASGTSNFLDIGDLIYGTGLATSGSSPSGNVGIGTTTPYSRLEVWGPDSGASTTAFLVANSASTTEFYVSDNGNAVLAGGLTQNSDQRLKTNIQSLDASSSLAAINALNPVTFTWIDPSKGGVQLGFLAQQVFPIFPDLISTTSATALTPDGTLGLNYTGLIAPIVRAIQAISSEITSIENTITGFADSFTTKELTFTRSTGDELAVKKLDTQELCATKSDGLAVCVTGDQLAALLSQSAAAALANPSPASGASGLANPTPDPNAASSTPDTPPVIQINGDNPATIHIGDTYSDLGATITDPQADLNLGITTYVNGTQMNPVQINTSTAATDTVAYVVTDSAGLSSTSTRTVIVQAAAAVVVSNDASSTSATTTAQ